MASLKEDPSFDLKGMEKWLQNFFLDPLTSYLDETAFRVDIFETEEKYILEALLSSFHSENLTIFIDRNQIEIKAFAKGIKGKEEPLVRKIDFPFCVTDKEVSAQFSEGILEIYISKNESGSGKQRFVIII